MSNKNLDDYFEKKFTTGINIGSFIGGAAATLTSLAIYYNYGKEIGDLINKNIYDVLSIANNDLRNYLDLSVNTLVMLPIVGPLFSGFIYGGEILGGAITGNFLKNKEGFEEYLRKKSKEINNKNI